MSVFIVDIPCCLHYIDLCLIFHRHVMIRFSGDVCRARLILAAFGHYCVFTTSSHLALMARPASALMKGHAGAARRADDDVRRFYIGQQCHISYRNVVAKMVCDNKHE